MAAIRVIRNGNQLDRRELGDSIVIGRGAESDLRLADADVSRTHCRIERSGDGYVLIDLGSRNGTVVGGTRISRRRLRDGEVLRVGNCTLQFEGRQSVRRTLDDEVLEMLNDVAPSPAEELERVGAAVWAEELRTPQQPLACAPAEPHAKSRANSLAETADPPRTASRTISTASLWETALRPRPAASTAPDPNPHPQSGPLSWEQRRVPLPLAIGAALALAAGLYAMTSGVSLPHGSAPPPQKALPHSNPQNRD